jgi:uncharacterized repeat protein (TIGR01451 family)
MFRSTISRSSRAVFATVLGVGLLAAVPAAGAAPGTTSRAAQAGAPTALGDNGPFSATASGSLLTLAVPALSPAILPQTDIDLAHSEAAADSDADLDAGQDGPQRTAALAATTGGTELLDTELDLATTTATAPEDEAHDDVLVEIPENPLLGLDLIRTSAAASWAGDLECVASETPLSIADQVLADLTVLEPAPGQSVVELETDPVEGAVNTEAETRLASIDGPGADQRAVLARATSSITSANVLNGLAGEGSAIRVEVVQAPDLTAQASGLPGGADVTGEQPEVDVYLGDTLITLDAWNQTEDATITELTLGDLINLGDASLVADLLTDLGLDPLIPVGQPAEDALKEALAALQPVVRISMPYDEDIAADGTSASAVASLLRIEVLAPDAVGAGEPLADVLNQILAALTADVTQPLLQLDLAPISVEAVAPAGGIDCGGDSTNPLRELNKHASATEVAPGGTFDYTISVPNRGPCALTEVVVTDTITGPAGFEVIDTEPDATVSGGTVTFDVGNLAVNETRDLVITVKVPADAPDGATFDDVVQAQGVCDGRPVSEEDRLDDVPTVRTDFTGPCSVQYSNKDASHEQVTPGETFSYYVHVYNTGSEPCTQVAVTDTLDDRVTFVSCTDGCDNSGQAVTWTIASLAGGSSQTLAVVVQVHDDATGTLANVALIDPANADSVTVRSAGPVVGGSSVVKEPAPAVRGRSAAPLPGSSSLPKTGGAVPLALAAILAAGALGLQALRRRSGA